MAAEAVVSFVVGKVGDLLIEEALLLHGVHDQIEWIERELKQMISFLKDADARWKENERIKNWVADIRDISYDAEDVIDTFISMVARGRRQGFLGLLKRYSCIFNKLITHHKVRKEIQQIQMRINDVSRRRLTYGIRDINEATSTNQNMHDRRRNFALLEEPDVVGFEEYRKTLMEQLINGDSRHAVISIVGMGGSGKTTLAKKVYRDVKKDFDCHAFIYLSQQHKIRDILIYIIQCVMSVSREDKLEMEKENEQVLMKRLSEHLTDKRYLVVIDDIWTKEAWDVFKSILPNGSEKSRVILTTRNREVAFHANPFHHPHEIRLLDDRESWELFLKKAFPRGSTCPSELEDTGRQILAKCGHLPLAIVVLGGLLSMKDKTLMAWSSVLENVTRHLTYNENECMEILALSYYDLPHYLKPCFMYLGLFPEDFEIQSKRLIRLWIAEGFIQQISGDMILEDVAEEYLEELIRRNMLQIASKRCNGSVSTCRIHNVLRDLSISEAIRCNFFDIINGDVDAVSSLNSKCRRLALHHDIGKSIRTLYHSTATLRSVLCFNDCELHPLELFSKGGKLLRVFDDWNLGTSKVDFSKGIGEFVHLRYLRSRKEILKVHPSSIANLYNLQTLELCDFFEEVVLPNAIYDLVQLRHLYAYCCEIEGQPRLDNLKNLQTLGIIRAGSWIENGLDKLTNLRKLRMVGSIGSYSNSLSCSIEKLCSLRSLTIADNSSVVPFMSLGCHWHLYKMFLFGPFDKLPDLPPNLLKLTLWYSELQKDDITKLEKLPELRILRLQGKWTCLDKWICSSPGFPQLETLEVDCKNLKEFIIEEGAMPCLKRMSLLETENLTTYPVVTKNYSLDCGFGIRDYEIRSMASTILGKDNASQYYEDDVGAPHATTTMVA